MLHSVNASLLIDKKQKATGCTHDAQRRTSPQQTGQVHALFSAEPSTRQAKAQSITADVVPKTVAGGYEGLPEDSLSCVLPFHAPVPAL